MWDFREQKQAIQWEAFDWVLVLSSRNAMQACRLGRIECAWRVRVTEDKYVMESWRVRERGPDTEAGRGGAAPARTKEVEEEDKEETIDQWSLSRGGIGF